MPKLLSLTDQADFISMIEALKQRKGFEEQDILASDGALSAYIKMRATVRGEIAKTEESDDDEDATSNGDLN
jgi:hypothetical protein